MSASSSPAAVLKSLPADMELVLERSILAVMGVPMQERAPLVDGSMSGVAILSLSVPGVGVVRSEQSASRARAGHDFGEDCPARLFIQRREPLHGALGLRRRRDTVVVAGNEEAMSMQLRRQWE